MASSTKKWKFDNIDNNTGFFDASKIVLSERHKDVLQKIDDYFKNDSVENLHELRIAIRRFRYVLEIFYICIEAKLFKKVYNTVKNLQDLIGEGRDLDVLEIQLGNIEKESSASFPKYLYKNIADNKTAVRQKIKLELINFISDKNITKIFSKE